MFPGPVLFGKFSRKQICTQANLRSRHDLNPTAVGEADPASPTAETSDLPPPLTEVPAENVEASTGRRRMSRFLDLHRLRNATTPEQRIAELRRYREESRAAGEPVEDPSRRARRRLADAVRTLTFQQPRSTPQPTPNPQPAAPAPDTTPTEPPRRT